MIRIKAQIFAIKSTITQNYNPPTQSIKTKQTEEVNICDLLHHAKNENSEVLQVTYIHTHFYGAKHAV